MKLLFSRRNAPDAALQHALTGKGIEYTHLSLLAVRVRTLSVADIGHLRAAQRIVFTSPLTVELLAAAVAGQQITAEFAAVGQSTANAVQRHFARSAIIPIGQQGAHALLERLANHRVARTVVLAAPEGLEVFEQAWGNRCQIIYTHERVPAELGDSQIDVIKSSDAAFCASGAHWQVLRSVVHTARPVIWLPSARLAELASTHGWKALNTEGADDARLIRFLARSSA
jgi:uroporphyrinogen-III synthase